MKSFISASKGCTALLILLVMTACGDASEPQTAASADTLSSLDDIILQLPPSENLADSSGAFGTQVSNNVPEDIIPSQVDGVQVIRIEAGPTGYRPNRVLLQVGMPARLLFTRTTTEDCAKQIQIPKYGIRKTSLPLDEEVAIEFTPADSGEFAFTCGENVMTGTIIVES